VPVAFVSEHSETLVELDIDYRDLALREGAAGYHRVPAVGTAAEFIDGLAAVVRHALAGGQSVTNDRDGRLCAAGKTCGQEEAA
jgi:ferrochelatase